jgi:acetyl-CoA carboxylase carboxyltransferase component
VREVVRTISDEGRLLEIAPKWARNVVTALCRIDGWSVGIVANQPRYLGGVLDSEAAQKATRFVQLCNSFRIPLVVLVDTPGFMPGVRQEGRGVIRHGAGLLHAFAASTVPRITLVLRKAYGGAYISMNSRGLGANLAFAWPGAELGIMAASQAVGIVHRRDLEAAGGDQAVSARLADGYAREHLCVTVAAGDGLLDEVIEPNETRDRIAGALELLCQRAQNTTAGHQREYP